MKYVIIAITILMLSSCGRSIESHQENFDSKASY